MDFVGAHFTPHDLADATTVIGEVLAFPFPRDIHARQHEGSLTSCPGLAYEMKNKNMTMK